MGSELICGDVVSWSKHHIRSECPVWVAVDPDDEDTPIQLFLGDYEQIMLEIPRAGAEEIRAKLGTALDALPVVETDAAAATGGGES